MASNKFRSDLKIIVIGNAGTGKTSFVNKWTKNILGFFGGTKEGYIYDGKEQLDKCKYKKCEKLIEIPRTEYKILKNNKICIIA